MFPKEFLSLPSDSLSASCFLSVNTNYPMRSAMMGLDSSFCARDSR